MPLGDRGRHCLKGKKRERGVHTAGVPSLGELDVGHSGGGPWQGAGLTDHPWKRNIGVSRASLDNFCSLSEMGSTVMDGLSDNGEEW